MKDTKLILTLLGVAFLGNLARAAVAPAGAGLALGFGVFLLLPLLPVLALALQQRHPGVRWGAGLAAALASALCSFVLLDPQDNQDANIGLGLYVTFGWIPVLGGAALLGGLLGRLARPHAPLSPPLPSLSWRGWGWPLVLPLLGAAVNLWAEWRLGQRVQAEFSRYDIPAPDPLALLLATLPTLLLLLAVSALPLTLLRNAARRRGQAQPFLTWWWVTLGLLTLAQVWWTSAGRW
ncbi:MAG: hypothetical protein Q4C89_02055 [Deinococcus sp.]|uniref:hypothetical protein n=1 Tax=Deinococcus sp. TaxID=47478 RepID=UPI0026DB27D1|nr:hypothetical protein [Deinococcus sp.]MDO4244789.1 hypothetical protein [Deinococcus sp.]